MDPTVGLNESEEKKNLLPLPDAHLIIRSVVWTLYRLHYSAPTPMKFKVFSGCSNFSDVFVFTVISK
jgi:hypothetical protein